MCDKYFGQNASMIYNGRYKLFSKFIAILHKSIVLKSIVQSKSSLLKELKKQFRPSYF